jgi:two-component system response regulator NreC
MIRVVIVDDHALVRVSLRSLLSQQSDIECVGEAAGVEDAKRLAQSLEPDVVLLDMAIPGESGVQTVLTILEAAPESRVLALSIHDDPDYVRQAFSAGANGYVLKELSDQEVVTAVREVASGGRHVPPALGARLRDLDLEND